MALLSQALHLGYLLSPHRAFQGHAAHTARWPAMLSPNGSSDTCISDVGLTQKRPRGWRTPCKSDRVPAMQTKVTRLDYCQYLLVSQINYTLTHFADHCAQYSHD